MRDDTATKPSRLSAAEREELERLITETAKRLRAPVELIAVHYHAAVGDDPEALRLLAERAHLTVAWVSSR